MHAQHNEVWKRFVKELFKEVLAVVLPDVHEAVDWTSQPVFEDERFGKKLLALYDTLKLPDIVVKLRLKNGSVLYVCAELQNTDDKTLGARICGHYAMTGYVYKTRCVVPFAILTGKNRDGGKYEKDTYGTITRLTYRVFCLMDCDAQALKGSKSPVELALYAARCALDITESESKQALLQETEQLLRDADDVTRKCVMSFLTEILR